MLVSHRIRTDFRSRTTATALKRFSSRKLSLSALLLFAAAGCENRVQNQDELQGLLHDEPLTSIKVSSVMTRTASQAAGRNPVPADGTPDLGTGGNGGNGGDDLATGGNGGSDLATGGNGGSDLATGGNDGGDLGTGPPPPLGPLGRWTFDDCNPGRTNLNDSGPNFDTAFRAVSTTCTAGLSNQAVALAKADEDIVYVPDQPFFDLSAGVTVAGWFKATSVNKTRTLFRKRDDANSSSFALLLHNGRYQFVINLGQGRAASVNAPTKAKVGEWTHVAGTYDNGTLRLYVNGVETGSLDVAGTLAPAPGPFLMGNDGSKRLFAGLIDNAFFDARALSADEVMQLTCVHQPATVVGTPAISSPTQPGVPATFDIAVKNNDPQTCAPSDFAFFTTTVPNGITTQPGFQQLPQIAPGDTAHLTMTVTASDSVDPDTFTIPFLVVENGSFFSTSGSVEFVLAGPAGCHVTPSRELMIKHTSVVDDPIRTVASAASGDPRSGAWTLKRLLENMAPTPADAPSMLEDILKTFTTTTSVNGFTINARPGFKPIILDAWPRDSDGRLDLARPPVMLQAIVNRFDLRDQAHGDAGEGRFVFAFTQNGVPLSPGATLIFEYKLPAASDADTLQWANSWHALGELPFPSEGYNAALQAITDRFSARGARPDHVNGNAINAVRTNEIALGGTQEWQLREFVLSPATGRLVPGTIALTPDLSFKNTPTLGSFINANEAAILADAHSVPELFQGAPFLTGAVFNDLSAWFAPGIDPEVRHHFSLNTCNGCHSTAETGTPFLHITPRFAAGSEATLSGFLLGTTVSDPLTGQPRTFGDLRRRANDLAKIVCEDSPAPKLLRKGIDRVH